MSHPRPRYVPDALLGVPYYADRWQLLNAAAADAGGGIWAEFGVLHGDSARHLLRRLPADGRLYLFDSGEGLPADWRIDDVTVRRAGELAGGVPDLGDARVTFCAGWFADTLPYAFPAPLDLVHIDCDLYDSTVDVLDGIDAYVRAGTRLVFDELLGYPYYSDHEWRAVNEWQATRGCVIEWRGIAEHQAFGVVQ